MRSPGVRHVWGDRAEVWQGGTHAGNIYRYLLEGDDGRWTARATRYSLKDDWQPIESEFRFFIEIEGKVALELRGLGHIFSDVVPDGEVHREETDLEGTRLWIASSQ